jgi:hypothetical protein
MITRFTFILLLMWSAAEASGKKPVTTPKPPGPPEIKILNETTPPGGTVQLKFSLTEPQPITTGTGKFRMPKAATSTRGIAMFSSSGDVFGTAVVQGTDVQVLYVSPNSTLGALGEYPIVTVVAQIDPAAIVGESMPMGDGATLTGLISGQLYNFVVKPGVLTIGASPSIDQVVPGGGSWPAGTVIHVLGSGFKPGASSRIDGVTVASPHVVSPTEFDFTLTNTTVMDGQPIVITNPDKSAVTFYSYMRGVPQGVSGVTFLNEIVPIFARHTYSQAAIVQAPTGFNNTVNTALAIQNPGALPVNITLQSSTPANGVTGTATITLPAGGRIVRELGEYFGTTLSYGTLVNVTSSGPVQVLGVLADASLTLAVPFPVGR